MHRTYTFKVTIREGSDSFWEGMQQDGTYRGYATQDEVQELLQQALDEFPIVSFDIELIEYREQKP